MWSTRAGWARPRAGPLQRAVAAGDTALAAAQVGTIRKLVAVNLSLGITVVLIATAGRYLLN